MFTRKSIVIKQCAQTCYVLSHSSFSLQKIT